MAEIYALYSTWDGLVRYVGESSGDRATRFKEHLRSAESRPDGCPLSRWFHQQWRRGYQVRHALLEVCDCDKRLQLEADWIKRFPRDDLLNRRKKAHVYLRIGGAHVSLPYRPPNPPRIAEILSYMRRYKNVDGFPGIQNDRDTEYYRVLVYNGRWAPRWLQDDRLADGQWFSDLARAVSARDKQQDFYRALMKERHEADIVAARNRERERIARGDEEDWAEGVPTPLADGTLEAIGGKLCYPAVDAEPLRMRGR
jgi:hypothetical protein